MTSSRLLRKGSDEFCSAICDRFAVLISNLDVTNAPTVPGVETEQSTVPAATFSALYQDHWDVVRSVASNVCGLQDAHDVTQEVFLRLWSNPERFDAGRGSMHAYLTTMTRSAAIDRLRTDNARHARERSQHAPLAVSEPTGDRLDCAAAAERVRQALGRLNAGESDAIIAAFFGEHSYQDVALLLGIPEGTAKSRIRSGLKKLRVELSDLEV